MFPPARRPAHLSPFHPPVAVGELQCSGVRTRGGPWPGSLLAVPGRGHSPGLALSLPSPAPSACPWATPARPCSGCTEGCEGDRPPSQPPAVLYPSPAPLPGWT